MMVVLLIIGLCYFLYPLIVGFSYVEEFEFKLEIKDFSSLYYVIGVFFVEHSTEDPDYIEQEFTIALYFVTFNFIFYKRKENV